MSNHKEIIAEPTGKPLSRQRQWQLDHKARNLCASCSRKRASFSKTFCKRCAIRIREKRRKKLGCKKRYKVCKGYGKGE